MADVVDVVGAVVGGSVGGGVGVAVWVVVCCCAAVGLVASEAGVLEVDPSAVLVVEEAGAVVVDDDVGSVVVEPSEPTAVAVAAVVDVAVIVVELVDVAGDDDGLPVDPVAICPLPPSLPRSAMVASSNSARIPPDSTFRFRRHQGRPHRPSSPSPSAGASTGLPRPSGDGGRIT